MNFKRRSFNHLVAFLCLSFFHLYGNTVGAQPTVATGGLHSFAIKGDGTLWAWGGNYNGELGNGTTTGSSTPVQVKGPGGVGFLSEVVAADGGQLHSIAVKQDGTVWTWGRNSFGQLGDGTTIDKNTPVQVKGPGGVGFLTGITSVAAGVNNSIALRSDGTVWTWGLDFPLLDMAIDWKGTSVPIQVKGPGGVGFLTGITAIASGHGWFFSALKGDGTVWAWSGLGDGTTESTPSQVKGPGGVGFLTGVIAIAARESSHIAIKGDGTVWQWSSDGDGSILPDYEAIQVTGPGGSGFLTGVVAAAGGSGHTIVLKGDGTVWAWGRNISGKLGDGTTTDSSTPVQVKGPGGVGFLTGIMAISAGYNHNIALKTDGTVWTWGINTGGKLGDGTTTERHTPVQVVGPGGNDYINLGSNETYEYYLPYALSNSNYWTGVGLKNGSQTENASVTVYGIDQSGTVFDSQVKTIPAKGQTAFMMKKGEGWIRIISNQPLMGLGFIAMVADEKLMFDIPFISETATTLHIPHVAQDATWDTTVYVCNPNNESITLYLTFVKSDGSIVTSKKYTLQSNGSGKYPLSEVLGGNSYTSGSVEITASKGVSAFALYQNIKTGARSYAGINAEINYELGQGSYNYYLPYALCNSNYWTGVGLKNGSKTETASVTVYGISQSGSIFDSQAKTIPARGQTAFMMKKGEGWVRITSNQPLMGLGFIAMVADEKLMFDIPFISETATTLHIPHVAQDATWDTTVYVCNPNNEATTFSISFVKADGTVVTGKGYTLPKYGSGKYPLANLLEEASYSNGSTEIRASNGVAAFALYENLKTGEQSYAGISAGASYNKTIISTDALVIDSATISKLKSVSADQTVLTFSSSTQQLSEIEIGDVLCVGVTNETPYGLLRKVTSVRKEGGQVIVETDQATLTDVFEEASISLKKTLGADDISSALTNAKTLKGVTISTYPSPTKALIELNPGYDIGFNVFSLKLSNVILYDDDDDKNTR